MSLAAIQLKHHADTAVATREDALNFANAALARRKHTGNPLKDYTPGERERAEAIYNVCCEYYDMRVRGGFTRKAGEAALRSRQDLTGHLLDEGRKLTARTLDDWLAKLGGSVRDAKPPVQARMHEVCRDYGRGAAKRINGNVLPEAFMEEFWNAYNNQNSMMVAPAYRVAKEIVRRRDATAEIPNLPQVRYWLRTRVNKRVLAKGRLQDEKYRNGFCGYVMRNWNCEVGEVWVGDHRILDIWVRVRTPEGNTVAVRPWVTAWMDVKSGYMVATLIYADAYPNHAKILEALYLAIVSNGCRPPKILLTDNGKDYLKQGALQEARMQPAIQPTRGRNRHRTLVEETFAGVLGEHSHSVARELGIKCELSAPYKGRQKPIERRFRDFAQEFDRMWPGFTGNSPATRPDYGQTYRGNPETLPTCEEVRDAFRQWLRGYHARPNNSRVTGGRAPAELWKERRDLRPAMTVEDIQWAMLVPHRNALQVRTGPSGCDVWYHGWPYSGRTPDDCLALREHWKQDIMVKTSWAPHPGEVFPLGERTMPLYAWAFTVDGKYICPLKAEPEVDVWSKSKRNQDKLNAAMHRIKTIEKADREQRDMLRGRKTVAFPGRKLYPHGKGDLPELEGGPTVSTPMTPGPGRGRAKRLQAAGGSTRADLPSKDNVDWDDVLAAGPEPEKESEIERALRENKDKEMQVL